MSEFTYEYGNRHTPLETYEWDNIWCDHADRKGNMRALLIGDSISCGYRVLVNNQFDCYHTDSLGTSKAIDHPQLNDLIRYMLKAAEHQAVFFNNGLHGWHLSTEEYASHYERVITTLLNDIGDTPLVIVLTTPERDRDESRTRNERIVERNMAAKKIAAEHDLQVLDLYTPVKEHPDYFSADGVHLTSTGYEHLASLVADAIRSLFDIR